MSKQDVDVVSSMKNFQEVISTLSPDLQRVDTMILEFAQGRSPLIKDISEHLINSGGKRVRPVSLLLAAQLCGDKKAHDLAAAVELIHSATLLHDDVVDTSLVRRGKKTANALWDNKASILVGDYLFSVAFQFMVRSGNLRVLDLLAKASSTMADGEVMQLQNSNDVALSEEKYLEIIFGKTAVLFSAACECGALLNNRPESEISALREFGKNLGIVFQIVDDVLDYEAESQVFGKEIGGDFFEGKVTLPIILTYSQASLADRRLIEKLFAENLLNTEKDPHNFRQAFDLLAKYNGLGMARDMALSHHELALKNLEIFVDSDSKQGLITVLNNSFSRLS
ncbi:MAG: polyprenyl synthetase family protein [Alphaproteobacteria bacterium]|nr:polyprenyl synthetase family protein [Alphaproteobacteria bacterium]